MRSGLLRDQIDSDGWYARFLQFVIASYEGLVKINDLSLLPEVALKLMDQSMVGVYFVENRLEDELVRQARATQPRDDLGIKVDPSTPTTSSMPIILALVPASLKLFHTDSKLRWI